MLCGCRTEKSLSNKEIWYAMNRVTGRDLIVAGLLALAASLLVFPFRHKINDNYAIAILLGNPFCFQWLGGSQF